jgi:hypothetical protein
MTGRDPCIYLIREGLRLEYPQEQGSPRKAPGNPAWTMSGLWPAHIRQNPEDLMEEKAPFLIAMKYQKLRLTWVQFM